MVEMTIPRSISAAQMEGLYDKNDAEGHMATIR